MAVRGVNDDLTTLVSDRHGPTFYDHHLSEARPVWCSAVTDQPPTAVDVHVHRGLEVGLVLAGSCELSFGEMVVQVEPGEVWLCAMWEPHGWRIGAPGTQDLVVIFLPEFLGDESVGDLPWLSLFAVPPVSRPWVARGDVRSDVLIFGRQLMREIQDEPVGWQAVTRHYLALLLTTLRRAWEAPASLPSNLQAGSVARIMPALQLLHRDPTKCLSVAEAAAACGFSRPRFDTLFRETMGLSFGRFRDRARLTVVAQQLLTTGLAVADIAHRAGFVDGSHLHHRFVKRYGCTPAEYRRAGGVGGSRGTTPRA